MKRIQAGNRMASFLVTEKLAALVRTKRGSRGLRETASEIGNISASTLSRVEHGKPPDLETFMLLCDWLGIPPAEFFGDTEASEQPSAVDPAQAIEIQLRCGKDLDPATANALAALVRAAYRDLSQRQPDKPDEEQ
jgi:transcriptional regulator with XRE-family HTH domain